MKITRLLQLLFATVLLFNISCSTDSSFTLPEITYENGFLITNEGNYGKPNAEVTFVSRDLTFSQNNIFSKNNNGSQLGDVLQAAAFSGDKAYLLLNNSNKIQVVNRYTFKSVGEITNQINYPRYIAVANNNVYVTNDQYQAAKYLSIYKTSDLSFVKKIAFTENVERIVEAGGNIFIQNASFGFGNKITYINTSSNTVQSTITLPNGNINRTISYNSNVYVIASTTTDSYIYQISGTGNITKTTKLTGIANATNLQIEGGKYFFSSANKVYSMDMNTTTVPTAPIITAVDGGQFYTLYGFSVVDGKIFTSDVKGFTEDSEVTVYNTLGTKIKSFTTGKGTNGVYLN
ncbi:hypothetical protein IQ37_16685 [Chryseobacterium piperi]|uniref:Lipoprotein n=1 Tax=Chryseobacterium piperi TaxID=558152 RepID=A0A086AN80_9FLAO|nr:hypothetical protein [Chryseobacterium piperi]ASW76265.1 hypothetical protein CJF12_19630 [Chryseobacterium piperi]KFF18144.1 hypothetical protein IQ37_16685 [Chryseobacterium piperi]